MENQELLTQVSNLLKQHTDVITDMISEVKNDVRQLQDEVRQVRFEVEVNVSKRIEVLFDGYKLTHEKQWEQQRQIDQMANEMEALKLRILSLESRGA